MYGLVYVLYPKKLNAKRVVLLYYLKYVFLISENCSMVNVVGIVVPS